MIKGRGGALLREKIVASIARRRVTMIEPRQAGRVAWGRGSRSRSRSARSASATPRRGCGPSGRPRPSGPATTARPTSPTAATGSSTADSTSIADPAELDRKLGQLVGVFETGLFIGLCDVLIVGLPDRAEVIANVGPRDTQ